jgi:translation elongation factor P/translation initiation factor 5A
MHCRLIRTLGLALVVLCLGLALAVADIQTIKGKIQSINQDGEGFTLQTEDKKSMAFKTPPELLEDLKPGDEVLVTIDDGEVIAVSLNKEDAD